MSRIHCSQCRMSFRVERPSPYGGDQTERLICPDCKRPFWAGRRVNIPGRAIVGVDPKNLAEWTGDQP